MFNVTLRRTRVTAVAVEKHCVLHNSHIVPLSILHAMRMHHIVLCDLPRTTVLSHTI
jgi:hypothetical protein